jgi:hypothetical protein
MTKKYRPFKDAAEFTPFRDRWIANPHGVTRRVEFYNDFGANGISWNRCFAIANSRMERQSAWK